MSPAPGRTHDLEREARLGEEVLRAVAIRELRPRPHEDVEVAGRLVRRDRDRILLREGLKVRVDVVRQPVEQREVGHRRDQAARQDDLQPPDLVRQPAEEDEERRAEDERDSDHQIGEDVVQLQRDGEEEQGVELARVPHHALARGGAQERQQHVLVVRVVEEALGQRSLRSLALFLHLVEQRGLIQPEPDIDREHQQDDGHEERNAPAPLGEHLGVHVLAAKPDDDEREQEAERGRGLNPARGIAALTRPGVLGHIGRRAAVLAAERGPWHSRSVTSRIGASQPMAAKVGSRPTRKVDVPITMMVTRKGVFAADQIADAPEDQRAERTDQEARRVGRERRQQRRRVVARREEQRGEERRQHRVKIEVVPLENGAERRGEDDELLLPRHAAFDCGGVCCRR